MVYIILCIWESFARLLVSEWHLQIWTCDDLCFCCRGVRPRTRKHDHNSLSRFCWGAKGSESAAFGQFWGTIILINPHAEPMMGLVCSGIIVRDLPSRIYKSPKHACKDFTKTSRQLRLVDVDLGVRFVFFLWICARKMGIVRRGHAKAWKRSGGAWYAMESKANRIQASILGGKTS